MNEYNIDVRTRKNLGDPNFVRNLLEAWRYDIDSRLEPEFFGLGEPIRHSFAEKGVDCAVNTWISEGRSLMLRRQHRFKYIVSINWWRRENHSLDKRAFPWSCQVWLNLKAGDELAFKYFRFLIEWFEPAFGHLSTDEQDEEKHFIKIKTPTGSIEKYAGLEVDDKLPGVYWITYFGPPAIARVGHEKFGLLSSAQVVKFKEGILVKSYASSKEIGSQKARESENLILEKLGKHLFFDRSRFDPKSLLLSSEAEKLINERIKEMKS